MEKKYKNRMGMFDFIRGIAIFFVVIKHTICYWGEGQQVLGPIFALLYQTHRFWMPVFLMISGYWFSAKDIKDYTRKRFVGFVKSYLKIGVAATICYAIIHYCRFHSVRATTKGSIGVMLAFLFGSKEPLSVGPLTIYDVGPAWFLVVLCLGDILLNIILNIQRIHNKFFAVATLAIVGLFVGKLPWVPFCMSTTLVSVLGLYIGYELKRSKYLISVWKLRDYIGVILLSGVGICIMGISYFKSADLEILAGLPGAILLLRLGLYLEKKQNRVIDFFKRMGRYTLWILMVHTVEMLSFDWRILKNTEYVSAHPWVGVFGIFILRWIVIIIGCLFISAMGKMLERRKRDESI